MIEKIKHEKYRILKRNIIEDSDFTKETLLEAIAAYQKRERRFGGLQEE